ncbi:B-cell linker protein-like [Littorina saxatilis]|uniref:B-cell linker protein-like n=1 Tax=Littorina saxatilis TaxID=31220 RepID=UPI0038B46627
MSSPLPPPLPPPKDQKKPEPRLHPQPKGTSTSVTKLPGGPGMFINPNQLLGQKKNLRKVSTKDKPGEKNNSAHEPKEYGDCSQTVFEVKRKLEGKADGRPGISLKPVPKSGGVNTFSSKGNNSTVTNGSRTQNALKPNHAVRSPPVSGQQSTSDVTFLPKANKDKHTNVPLPPVPAPHQQQKPAVSKFEFKPEVVMPPDPEEIYDDATSGDLLERYEWFHGIIDRQNGESRVKSVGKDGTYLVRVSEKDPTFPYTLVVLHNSHVNNLRIRKRQKDGKFALGDEKSDELAFTDVPAMISHHKNHHVVLLGNSQSHVKLQQTPPKG